MSEFYDENNPRILTAKEKAVKDYKEAGYAVDDDASNLRSLVENLSDTEGNSVDILWDKDRPYNIPDA